METAGKVGWGVIGACGIAKRRTIPEGIVPAANARLVAVTDVNAAGSAEVAAKFGAKNCPDIKSLLRMKEVQAVYIATPNHLHKEHVVAAARRGKHVLCEKPLGMTTSEIKRMIAACRKKNVLLGAGFMMRFNVYHQKLRDMLRDGALGVPVMARGQMTCWYPPTEGAWRQVPELGGGGSLVDMGAHVVDVMEMLFGRTRSVVARTMNRVHNYKAEETAILLLEFESGVPGIVDVSFGIPDEASEFVLEVYGSKGAVKGKYSLGQGPGGEMRACILGGMKGYDAQQNVQAKSSYQPWELPARNTYQSEIEAFSDAILQGKTAPVPGEDGLWNHAVMEAAYKSARTGKAVAPKLA